MCLRVGTRGREGGINQGRDSTRRRGRVTAGHCMENDGRVLRSSREEGQQEHKPHHEEQGEKEGGPRPIHGQAGSGCHYHNTGTIRHGLRKEYAFVRPLYAASRAPLSSPLSVAHSLTRSSAPKHAFWKPPSTSRSGPRLDDSLR